MDFLSGGNDLGTLGLGLLMAGAAAGLVSGVLKRGAGLILVSALFLVARSTGLMPDKAMLLAVGTSFACLVPLSLSMAAATKSAADPSRTRLFHRLSWLGMVAAAAMLSVRTTEAGVAWVLMFAAVSLAAAILAVLVTERRDGDGPRGLGGGATAVLCAFFAFLTGIGGASLTTPSLMLWGLSRKDAERAAANLAIRIALLGSLLAVIYGWNVLGLPRHSYGYVNLLAFGIVAPAAFVTNLIAAHYADLIDAKKLRWLFAAFVLFSAGRMVWSVVA
jgi:uncharacterized membrane protein YfcA